MVVEDNPNLLALFTYVLVRAGHAVTPCRDAAAALDQVRETPPDLVITDFDLPPGMTGLHLVQALRSSPTTAHIPIMMVAGSLSGMSGVDRTDLACYLGKPVLPADLVRHVQQVLEVGRCT